MKRTLLAVALATFMCASASADEGMWMVSTINKALEKKMQERGLKLTANEIYNADVDGAGLCDAVVSLDFGCTGSIISDNGLVITNHHCAYSDVYALSTPEHNYLQDGYWAFYQKDEIPIPHKGIQILKKVIDVTEEANAVIGEYNLEGKPLGSRKLSSILEKKYQQETGYEASLDIMWSGSKYYISLYQTYSDIRLVASPPVSIAAFGGDIDNWEWPQHKGDFAMYRIYAAPDGSPAEYSEDNVPLKSACKLKISTEGYGKGDYAMVIGYPGITSRYSSSAKIASSIDVTLPIMTSLRGKEMSVIKGWMDRDPMVRLLYADWFFTLSNSQELEEGTVLCCKRFGVVDKQKQTENELQEWIDADSARRARWGNLISNMNRTWNVIRDDLEQETHARESLIRASRLGIVCLRLQSNIRLGKSTLPKEYESLDLRVEKDLFQLAMEEFFTTVRRSSWSDFHRNLWDKFNGDYAAMCDDVWSNSVLTDLDKLDKFRLSDDGIAGDPFFEFYTSLKMTSFTNVTRDDEGKFTRTDLGREYTRALYQMREDKGIAQYPDANSSMRITYGTVGELEPYDAVVCDWKSSAKGILEKYVPDDIDFDLKPEWKSIVGNYTGPVDFITDCDITGGNSGSPVMNARGELVGLAFDGNKESLASDVSFTEGYNKCVCVDIRYVLYILKEYAKFDRITEELGI